MNPRTVCFKYLAGEYYGKDSARLAQDMRVPERRVARWMTGKQVPSRRSLELLCNCIFTPEFQRVKEFFPLNPDRPMKANLDEMFASHPILAGIYAMYDSMANLIYVGKSKNLRREIYDVLRRPTEIKFPSGHKNTKGPRREVVRYVSAYSISRLDNYNDYFDYPEHIESLILRISKPVLNKKIGSLKPAVAPLTEDEM